MLEVKPFQAMRPKKENVEHFVVPPYDVLTAEDVLRIKEREPQSFIRVIRSEVLLPQCDPHDPAVYRQSRTELEKMLEEGSLVKEEAAYYIYEQEWEGRRQEGVVYIASAKDYEEGRIKKHELTLCEKEKDRTEHFRWARAQTEPVFFFAPRFQTETSWRGEKLYDFLKEGVVHRLWKVDGKKELEVEKRIQALPAVYIADGHHRSASAAKMAKEFGCGMMAVLFPGETLNILPYHRLIRKLPISVEKMLQEMKTYFHLEETPVPVFPQKSKEYGFIFQEKNYLATFLKEESDMVKNLDCSIIQDHILEKLFHIQDPRTDGNLDFAGGNLTQNRIRELQKTYDLILLMPATKMEDIVAVADGGKIMPPKSTWFEPKLISGLFLYPYTSF